jgi:hypothetical protein
LYVQETDFGTQLVMYSHSQGRIPTIVLSFSKYFPKQGNFKYSLENKIIYTYNYNYFSDLYKVFSVT